MRSYNEYKDSGVQWIGKIPGHWKTVRVKALLSERVDKSDTGLEEPLSMSQKYGIIPTKEMDVVPNMASSFIGAKRVLKKDLVFNKLKAHLGVFAISEYDGLVSPDYAVYTPNERVYLPFMEYMFHTPLYIREFTKRTTGVAAGFMRLYTDGLFAIPFVYPPIIEQHSIVSYLDDKCSKIDKILAGKQKQIELLAEMKQRIISDAVTHGLNPDVKMKATNIPWLPEIPEHWTVKPIRAILRENNEKTETGDEELLSLSQYTGISRKRDAGKTGMFEAESTIGYKKVHPGQFVMNIMLAWNGSYAVSGLEGIISPAYCVFDFISNDNKMYYNYLWRLGVYQGAFKTESRGIIDSRLRLYPNKFLPFPTICPPLEEQDSIVNYINEKVVKIDTLTSKLLQEIEAIKEYKQRLISDVVTGQIKVC